MTDLVSLIRGNHYFGVATFKIRYGQLAGMTLKTCEWCGKKQDATDTLSCRFVTPRFKKKTDVFTSEEERYSESRRLEFNGLIFVGAVESPLYHFCCEDHRRLWQKHKEMELDKLLQKRSSKRVDAFQMQVALMEFSECCLSQT